MIVLLIGDSFALPRVKIQGAKVIGIETEYEHTYPEMLRKMLKDYFQNKDVLLINKSNDANTSQEIINRQLLDVYIYKPKYLIIQVGICDCWEREKDLPSYPQYRGKNPWVNEGDYIKNLKSIINQSFLINPNLKNVIVVNIFKATQKQYSKHKGSYERTIKYSNRLKELIQIPNVAMANIYNASNVASSSGKNIWIEDGVHPNPEGSRIIANEIFNKIKQNDNLNKVNELLNTLTDCLKYIREQIKIRKYENTYFIINDFLSSLNIIQENMNCFVNKVYEEKIILYTNQMNVEINNLVALYEKEQFDDIENLLNQQLIPRFNLYKSALNEYIKNYELNIKSIM